MKDKARTTFVLTYIIGKRGLIYMKVITIVSLPQAQFYAKNGVLPFKTLYSEKYDRIVFLYDKKATKEVWEMWRDSKKK